MTPREALAKAIETAGSQTALATICGVKQGHVWQWLNTAKKGTPAEHCPAIEKATGVPRWALRPDVFEAPGEAA